MPAANDGTVSKGTSTVSSRKRDGMRSVVRRRSPRGNSRTRSPSAAASAARNRRWSSLTRVACNGSAPSVAASLGVGEQRVVVHATGEHPFGETAHEHSVQVEPEPERDVSHEDAVAEAPHPAEVGVQLQLEGATEHGEAGSSFDGVEPGQAFQRGVDLVCRLAFRFGPRTAAGLGRQEIVHEPFGPAAQLAPSLPRIAGEGLDEVGDEHLQGPRRATSSPS